MLVLRAAVVYILFFYTCLVMAGTEASLDLGLVQINSATACRLTTQEARLGFDLCQAQLRSSRLAPQCGHFK